MSEYIHQDDAYAWLRDKEIVFAEQDFAKVQAELDEWRKVAKDLYHHLRQLWVENYDHRYEPKMPCSGCCDALGAYEKAQSKEKVRQDD
jgi:hypothetical protein